MIDRGIVVGLIVTVLAPTMARSQGLEIDHKAVGCLVVGKFPKMNACFTPVSSLARSRVYFRPEGAPTWYYVDMKSDQPCFSGVLPKPGKKLVGKKVEYYVEAQDKTFNPARTAEYQPIVVSSAQECKKNVPVAPFLNNATVAVFPSLPAGFAAGGAALGTGAVLGIVGAGAAAAGTAVVVANHNNDTTTTTPVAVNTTTTVATTTTTTVAAPNTTTTLPTVNHPPNAVLKTVPDPPSGSTPLTVLFDMCGSSDPDGDPLTYFFDFGDGSQTSGACSASHTYTASSFRSGSVRAQSTTYVFQGTAADPKGASQSRTRNVIVDVPAPTTTMPCGTPTVLITAPLDGTCFVQAGPGGGTVRVDVTASDAAGISRVFGQDIPTDCSTGVDAPPPDDSGVIPLVTPPDSYSRVFKTQPPSISMPPKCLHVSVDVTNNCGNVANATHKITLASSTCGPPPSARDVAAALVWSSDLTVEGGQLQVVVNGAAPTYPGRGRAYGMAAVKDGENRLEATLAAGSGKPGLWRLEFMGSQLAAGSIRVVAGEPVLVADSSVTFRFTGVPGERISITFDKKK
jgi:PKD domain